MESLRGGRVEASVTVDASGGLGEILKAIQLKATITLPGSPGWRLYLQSCQSCYRYPSAITILASKHRSG